MNNFTKKIVHFLLIKSILTAVVLAEDSSQYSSKEKIYISQFANPVFPDVKQSSRKLVNNKRMFKWYASQPLTINFENKGVTAFDLFINGKKIDVNGLIKEKSFDITVNHFIHDGNDNTLSIQNMIPTGASLTVNIPYPVLKKGAPEDVGFSIKKLKKVDELIEKDVTKGFPGASIVIVKNGKIVKASSYGYTRKYENSTLLMKKPERTIPITMYDMASNSKMFSTNFAIMHLVNENKININDPVHKYLPLYTGTDENGQSRDDRTIKDLLTYSAGYGHSHSFDSPRVNSIHPLYSQNKTTTEKIICSTLSFSRPKGGVPKYSDENYILLGIIVEHVTGMPLDKYVESHIYHPLGLGHTVYNPLEKGFKPSDCAATELTGNTRGGVLNFPNIRTSVLQGQVHDEKAFYCMSGVSGHAGLFSNILDMAVLMQVMLNQGGYGNVKLWDRNIESEFVKPGDLDITFGLGWRRQGNENLTWHFGPYASEYAVGHTGWTGTVTVIDPQYDLAIALLTNKKHSIISDPKNAPDIFFGDSFETGQYGSVITLIYEALINVEDED